MKKEMNDKGFSLVELIIVIAIMAVLVGLLAPQYLKYVNNSKVSTDVTNAQEIATVVNTLISDQKITSGTSVALASNTVVTVLPTIPSTQDYILFSLGKAIVPKYHNTCTYTVTYSITGGVSKITFTVPTGVTGEGTYEAYPNPDNTTDGMNDKLKK